MEEIIINLLQKNGYLGVSVYPSTKGGNIIYAYRYGTNSKPQVYVEDKKIESCIGCDFFIYQLLFDNNFLETPKLWDVFLEIPKLWDVNACPIIFRDTKDHYGWLHNYFKCSIKWDDENWNSAEHVIQANRLKDPYHQGRVRKASNAFLAKKYTNELIQNNSTQQIENFNLLDVIYEVLNLKFNKTTRDEYSTYLSTKLECTGDSRIIYYSTIDHELGCSFDHNTLIGQNQLGEILMKIRYEIKNAWKKQLKG